MRVLITVLVLLLLQATASAETIQVQVTASADDAHAYGSAGLLTTFGYPRFGQNGNLEPYESAARFVDLPIDSGADIDSAFLEFRAYGSWSTDSIVYEIAAEDTADASAFSDRTDYDSRLANLTAASSPGVLHFTTSGNWYRSPDLAEVIQVLVDRPDWRRDSSDIALFLGPTDDTPADVWFEMYHFDGDSASAHRLYVYIGSGAIVAAISPRRRLVVQSMQNGGN
jgi:hypothetical protein